MRLSINDLVGKVASILKGNWQRDFERELILMQSKTAMLTLEEARTKWEEFDKNTVAALQLSPAKEPTPDLLFLSMGSSIQNFFLTYGCVKRSEFELSWKAPHLCTWNPALIRIGFDFDGTEIVTRKDIAEVAVVDGSERDLADIEWLSSIYHLLLEKLWIWQHERN